jgi:hypothetical protein
VTPLDLHIGEPAGEAPFTNCTVLLVSGGVANGIFALPAIGAWDRVSAIGPLKGPATASAPLRVVLKTGNTLSITTLESARPYGNASFQVILVPDVSTVTVEGNLRKVREKDLYVRANGKVRRFRLLAKTQFRDPQGAAIRDSLLRSGDQVSVLVNPDDPETAVGVVLIRKRERAGT